MINKKEFEFLFDTYYTGLFAYAIRYVQSQEIAADIVQEVFCVLWSNKNSINFAFSAKSYLYSSVRNKCLNHLKHSVVQAKHENIVLNEGEVSEYFSGEDFCEAEMIRFIDQQISRLPEEIKDIFIQNKIEGITAKKIAETRNISVRTIEGQIAKALKILRQNISTLDISIIIFCMIMKQWL